MGGENIRKRYNNRSCALQSIHSSRRHYSPSIPSTSSSASSSELESMIESAGSDTPLPLPPSSSSFALFISLGRNLVFTGEDFVAVFFLKSVCVIRGKQCESFPSCILKGKQHAPRDLALGARDRR